MKQLSKSIETAEAHYYSRSRETIWHKGATSGLVQKIVEMRIDDDQDAVWLRVKVAGNGASCHVGYRSCFYRSVPTGTVDEKLTLQFEEHDKSLTLLRFTVTRRTQQSFKALNFTRRQYNFLMPRLQPRCP